MFLVVYDDGKETVYLESTGCSWTSNRDKAHRFKDRDTALASTTHWRHFGETTDIYLEVL